MNTDTDWITAPIRLALTQAYATWAREQVDTEAVYTIQEMYDLVAPLVTPVSYRSYELDLPEALPAVELQSLWYSLVDSAIETEELVVHRRGASPLDALVHHEEVPCPECTASTP